MKKHILSVLFLLILTLGCSLSVFAEEEPTKYIVDEMGVLSDDEIDELNAYADYLSAETGIDILFVFTYEEDLDAYVEETSLGSLDDQILMIENEDYWSIFSRGTAWDILDEEKENRIREAYDNEEYYNDAVAAYLYEAASVIGENIDGALQVNEAAASTIILDKAIRVVDMADLLNDTEEEVLLSQLDEISERQQVDIAVVTVNSLDGKSPMEYADDFYDYNGYGFGANNDGILLLVSMEDRDWWISTTGYGVEALTDAGINYISEKFLPMLSDGDYADAFSTYAKLCDEFITQAKNAEPFDIGNMPQEPFDIVFNLSIALLIGLAVAFVITAMMKSQLKSVRFQSEAANYVKKDSMKVTQSKDLFLYRNVDRREKPKESSSSGGSSTHTSSSGTTHGGGGGKF
ncbi:MAG: TPM domain-containing protein [Lachnospiraceae bacterium]|nr:TPM domain-containing protein [Lachnospiraceae bacterium]